MLGLALLFWTCGVGAQVRVCPPQFGYIQMPPFGYTDQNGTIQGYLAEIAKAVFAKAGVQPSYRALPAARLYQNVRSGDTLITMGPKDLVFVRDYALQSEQPAITMSISAYRLPGTPPVKSVADLRNRHVVIINGYSYGKLVKVFENPDFNIMLERVRTHESGLRMIQLQRADYFIDYKVPANAIIKARGITGLKRDTLALVGIHFFVSKACSNAEALMASINQAYAQLKESQALPRFEAERWQLNISDSE